MERQALVRPTTVTPTPSTPGPRVLRRPVPGRAKPPPVTLSALGHYLLDSSQRDVTFVPSGCTLLDCVLGGGWALPRVINVVGSQSSGKTLCAIEALTNFARQYPKGILGYMDAEDAFDESYAKALGLPIDRVQFVKKRSTVEDLFRTIQDTFIPRCLKAKAPGFFVCDSLDALSDEAEQKRTIEKGSYGMDKQKALSEFFRRLIVPMTEAKITLMIISQVRENIGVAFGERYRRSGGKALDFYASQIVWLADIGKIVRSVLGQKRVVGINVRAKCKKNKVGLPFRESDFSIIFGYGIDSLAANIEWLATVDPASAARFCGVDLSANSDKEKAAETAEKAKVKQAAVLAEAIRALRRTKTASEIATLDRTVAGEVVQAWRTIESRFMPAQSKYQQ